MQLYEENKIDFKNRNDKILEAKASFNGRKRYTSSDKKMSNSPQVEKKYPFCLIRMLMAGILFLLLVSAFHFQITFQGFNKEKVQQMLADERKWNAVINEVSLIIDQTK